MAGTTTSKVKKSDQLVEITVDDSFEKIVELDNAGKRLRFDPDPERFKQLAPDEVKKLSEITRYGYQIARDEWQDLKDAARAEEEDLLERITVGETMGRAKQRLHIDGKQQGYDYRWIRPDEKNEFLSPNRGWKVVKDGPERTLSNPDGRGPHVIGTKGSEELFLVKRSMKATAAERRARKAKRQAAFRNEDERQRAEIEAAGVPSIGDEDGRAWRDRTGAEE
jgi:hypothetical protein